MRTWFVAALLACGADAPETDTGAPNSVAPEDGPTPELGTWDEDEPVGIIVVAPSDTYFGPVTVWWQQRVPFDVRIDFRVDGGEWQQSPVYQGVAGLNRQSIIGIPTGETAEVRLVGTSSVEFETPAGEVTTPELPASFPRAEVRVDDESSWGENGRYFLTSINENSCSWCTGRYWTFIADRQGVVYWATRSTDNRQVLFAQISAASGDHVLWDEVVWTGRSRDSKIHRTYLDREIEIVDAPGHHHAFLELPDGTLVWGDKTSDEGEAITELPPGATATRTVWTCQADWVPDDGCRSNSMYFDEASDRYWVSFYTQSAIVEVDRGTGKTNWSSRFDGGPVGPKVYTFEPSNSQFDWQHGVVFLDDGNLLVSTDRLAGVDGEVHTVLAEYEIDREQSVLRQVWSFDPGYDARFNGETNRFANGNTLHVLGARSIAYEVERSGRIVWEIEYQDGKMLNRLEFLDDLWSLMAPPAFDQRVDHEADVPSGPPTRP